MNKYKVEIEQTETYIMDVLAKNEEEAKKRATAKFVGIEAQGTLHFYQDRDMRTEVGTVYDVTDTDDPFDE